ncbi:methyltransferase, FxLD system [Dactylosporangium vinaceum]|uniref:Protein-L-isoaspartate O-methyltransferase n=1 Tax=Dactylosporangium vinaceum TaxID=53362 RepID=A0ABV5M2R4_9ACTN|nr:methyltransferase, FxLD system [Dactylosporangium vinaceum]
MTAHADANGWRQLNLTFDTWQTAERTAAAQLGPLLHSAEHDDVLGQWWFVRKGPAWRLRLRPVPSTDTSRVADLIQRLTDVAAVTGLRAWAEVIYEPEAHRFGGAAGMDLAHTLFHADSRHLLQYLAGADRDHRIDHRRELSLVLATRLMRAAAQDWYEQGDIWRAVADHRAAASDDAGEPVPAQLAAVRQLILAISDTDTSPLHAAPGWPTAFEQAGIALAGLSERGGLTRGIRAILTDHVLFLFNRHGVAAPDQQTLASAARQVVFEREPAGDQPTTADSAATVAPVTTTAAEASGPAEPADARLRAALADDIRRRGTFRTPPVEAAFRTVHRHLFLPGVPLDVAYGTNPVVTKRDTDGASLSSASKPNLVAAMLEQLQAQPGQRVLEIGAATGINAALLAELVGPTGTVVTIELDEDLAAGARAALDRAGYPHVTVICGDGTLGHRPAAPYQRIIVTAEASDITDAWWDQLAPDGRIVAPIRLHGSGLTRSLGFALDDHGVLTSTHAEVCGFVPMRGATTTANSHVSLAAGVALRTDPDDQPDHPSLSYALNHSAHAHRTGIQVHDDQPAQHLDLWLLTHTTHPFGRLSVTATARGLADPARRWAGAGIYRGGTIAYITAYPVTDTLDELGVTAHGPDAEKLAADLTDLLHEWDQHRAAQPTVTAHRRTNTDPAPVPEPAGPGEVVRPDTRFSIRW